MQTTQRKAFHTGLLAFDYVDFPEPPYKGKNWHIDFVDIPKKYGSTRIDGVEYQNKEVIVWAETDVQAQRVADLIHSARLVIEGAITSSQIHPGDHAPIVRARKKTNRDPSACPVYPRVSIRYIPLACLIACRASFSLEYVYALAKLRLSIETFSLPLIELDPQQSPTIPKSVFPEDHVRFSFSIVTAWSCIEEFGFAIHASKDKPSKLPDGSWNPEVKHDLEGRLHRGGIDLTEEFDWNLRGSPTKIELKRAPTFLRKSAWSRYSVRDGEMEIIDALSYAHFLRSSIAAHKSDKRLIKVLSVYDVSNVQFLARRLLLEKMGFWRLW